MFEIKTSTDYIFFKHKTKNRAILLSRENVDTYLGGTKVERRSVLQVYLIILDLDHLVYIKDNKLTHEDLLTNYELIDKDIFDNLIKDKKTSIKKQDSFLDY